MCTNDSPSFTGIKALNYTSLALICITLACAMLSPAARAGSIAAALVTNIRVDRDGRAMVSFDKPVSSSPSCILASAYPNALAIDTNTAGGKAALALALHVKATGKRLWVYGTGACGIYGGAYVEDWEYGVSD